MLLPFPRKGWRGGTYYTWLFLLRLLSCLHLGADLGWDWACGGERSVGEQCSDCPYWTWGEFSFDPCEPHWHVSSHEPRFLSPCLLCWTGDRNAETYVYGFLDSSNIRFSSACRGPGRKGGPGRRSFSIPLLVATVKGDLWWLLPSRATSPSVCAPRPLPSSAIAFTQVCFCAGVLGVRVWTHFQEAVWQDV